MKCTICGKEIGDKEARIWNPRTKKAQHLDCYQKENKIGKHATGKKK